MARTRRYLLVHLLFMSFCAVLSHCEDWDQIAAFVKAKKSWFEGFFPLPKGTPCADTFSRVMGRLAPEVLTERWPRWLAGLTFDLTGQVIAFDGKASRGASDPEHPTAPLYLLHAFATESELLLGQLQIPGAPGEVAGTRELLKMLDVAGSILTFDANGCTQGNAAQIVEQKANYVFGLKGNRGPIFEQTKALFAAAQASEQPPVQVDEHDKGHGRLEHRTTRTLPATLLPAQMVSKWRGLTSLVEVERTREINGETSTEKHWYLTSLPLDPGPVHRAIRAHWSVENRLHWVLDVSMGEDRSRASDLRAASNLALLRRLALSLVSRPEAGKDSRVMKLRRAGWDDSYRLELLRLNAAAVQKPAELRCAGPAPYRRGGWGVRLLRSWSKARAWWCNTPW
jgi:predicted transposase YbfD/YdcC